MRKEKELEAEALKKGNLGSRAKEIEN